MNVTLECAATMSDSGAKKKITLEQVAEHSKPDDCWLVIDGKVYDVTPFLDNHPGGPEIVTDHAGARGHRARRGWCKDAR